MTLARRGLCVLLATLVGGMGSACGRTGMLGENTDGGWSKDTIGDRDTADVDLVAPFPDADRPDAAVRDLRRDALGADAIREADAIAEVLPGDGSCVPGPSTPTSVAVLDDLGSVLGLAVFGDRLIVGGVADRPIELTPRGRLVSGSLSRGDLTSYDVEEGIPQHLQAAGSALVYIPGVPQAIADGWSFSYTRVLRWDLGSGERWELAQPAGLALADATPLATNSQGEVFWIATGYGESAIATWRPGTRATSVSIRAPSIVDVLADDSEVYWKGTDETGYITLSSTPITGGAISVLYRSSSTLWTGTPNLIGIDDTSLYYAFTDPPRTGIIAMPKQGGNAVTALPGAVARLRLCVDETHVYWAEDSDASSIRRVAKAGGQAELLWTGPRRWIQAMTIDACNVYWVVANPFEIYYRSK